MFRIPGKIPIRISPFFWVVAGLIGWINSLQTPKPLLFTLLWIFVIFISVLVHEMGHALTALYFGQKPRIELVAFGGLTYPEGPKLKGWQDFLVVFDGPLFGLGLFLLATGLLAIPIFTAPTALYTLRIFQWVNLFWTIINLLPVMPLDGGHLLRIICEGIFGAKGTKISLFASMSISGVLSLTSFLLGFFIVGALFFLFAFQNFDAWRRTRIMSESDRDESVTMEFKEIEDLLGENRKEEAIERLEHLREKAKKGLIYHLATQYLAILKAEKRQYQEVYDLLAPIKKNLNPESIFLLHHAAYQVKDYPLVTELAGTCFQNFPDPDVAIRSAEACAALNEVDPSIGWLSAAYKQGLIELKPILERHIFDSIRTDPRFHSFLTSLTKNH